jgi:hypothetical protein
MRTVIQSAPGMQSVVELSSDGYLTTGTVQDCTAIAEQMKAMHNSGDFGSSDMRYAGRIPNVFVEKYCNDNGITFHEFMTNREHVKRLINDPALADFRVYKGRV